MLSMAPRKAPVKPPSTDIYPAWRYHPDGAAMLVKNASLEPGDPWSAKMFPPPEKPAEPADPKLEAAFLRVQLAEQKAKFDGAWETLKAEKEMAQSNLQAAEEQIEAMQAEVQRLESDLAQLATQKSEKKPRQKDV